ncbi:WYL domain-containing protein [Streptomyces sp. AC563]|uniref:helix-turn-helix transcriptional regulator n=1 Tax=Streptomyces buecherae TaxID=2763006 RepID=UPI00164DD349|nr:WYL domain-containing protein [Streptomyces buecherae]MBC3987390.1 WYL domain-containing protein [Streptomyces buecherae]
MAIAKAERLMNLALCLLETRRPLTKRELRSSIEAYLEADATGSDEAVNRMFERDKDDLRELGLVIETVDGIDGELGYLARRDSNRLPPITLDPEEAAALGLAAKVWQQARLAGAASGALQKLRAAGMPLADGPYASEPHSALEPRIPTHEAAFEPLMLACRDRRPVVFDYRKSNAARPERRTVEPWILECWRGHWYLAGWDRDRAAERVFRLSRITGRVRSRAGAFTAEVPDHVTVRETVETWAGETATSTARIRLRAGHGYPLRAKAISIRPVAEEGAADGEPAGWDELEIPYGHGLDAWLVEFGPDVVVLEPAELRADVVERLRAVANG